jgi:hypothetical protein
LKLDPLRTQFNSLRAGNSGPQKDLDYPTGVNAVIEHKAQIREFSNLLKQVRRKELPKHCIHNPSRHGKACAREAAP